MRERLRMLLIFSNFIQAVGEINAPAILKYVNYKNNRHIGRVKYVQNYFRQRVVIINEKM